ncbi:MAG: tagaturonate epimerase family protein [Cyclobacteriaceae bacterium]
MKLGKYSFGIGDRFAHQGQYQLKGFLQALEQGVVITPVWNKSNREHITVGSSPLRVRIEADEAVKQLGWNKDYFVDADHITLDTVDRFIAPSNFFTLDVADKINTPLSPSELALFLSDHQQYLGQLKIEGVEEAFTITEDTLSAIANKFYKAIQEARRIYDSINEQKASQSFAVEVSMDEVEYPQTPLELFFILLLLSESNIPVDTIAPKFTGRFNKGVDYDGDINAFSQEFEQDILVIKHCIKYFKLPKNLKLSVHTGSDKFSLYPVIHNLIKKHDVGLHLKTAGTTWLEELIGLAESEGDGLNLAKSIYQSAMARYDELTGPYATVLNIDREKLPSFGIVDRWSGELFALSLRHNQSDELYNPDFRQLLHTAYKIAAERGHEYLSALTRDSEIIGRNVHENIFNRHITPLFLGK